MRTPSNPIVEQMLTVHQLAALLNVSRRTVWRWLAQGRLPEPIRYSRTCVRWKASAIQAYLEALPSNGEWRGAGSPRLTTVG